MPSYATGKEPSGLKGLLGRAGYGAGYWTAPFWMPEIFNQGQSSSATSAVVNRAAKTMPGLKPNPQTDIGRRGGNELQYIGGQLLQGRLPYAGPSQRAQQTGQYGRYAPTDTQERSWLYSGGAAQSPGAAPAAERAYQQEVSRVAQLTAQDPELQRYEDARKKAKLAGPGSAAEQSAEDMGMQMWAKANPKLAAKVKPGQAGYDVIQNTLAGNAARAGAGFKLPDQLVPTPAGFPTAVPAFTQTAPGGYDRGFGITTNLAPGATLQALQPTPTAMPAASPTFNLGAAFGQPGVLDEETLKRFSDILLQSAK